MLISLFADVISEHSEFKMYVPVVTRDVIAETKDVGMNVRSKVIEDYVYSRYERIMTSI